MDRRQFVQWLITAGIGAVGLGTAGCGSPDAEVGRPEANTPYVPPAAPAPERKPLAGPYPLVVAAGNDPADLIERGFQALGGIERFVRPQSLVTIKPNVSVPRKPEEAATTNPWLVAAVVQRCLAAGAREVRVIDHTFTSGQICLETTAIRREVEQAGGKVYVINELKPEFYQPVALPGPVLTSVQYARDVLDADLFINMPILKHHNSTKLTMGLKNLMGVVWDRGIFHRTGIHRGIAELAAFRKPDLTILDAIAGITDRGPMGPGPIRNYNQVVLSTDPVAVDAYGAQLFGLVPSDLEYLLRAAELGVGQIDWSALPRKEV